MVYKTYDYNTEEEDLSENEYVEDKGSQENVDTTFSNIPSTPLRFQPERMTKLDSRAINQCLLEDEEVETSKAEGGLKESFGEGNLEDVVVVDKGREIPGLTGSFSIEINLNCEPPLGDTLVEKDWNQSGYGGVRSKKKYKSGYGGEGTRNSEIRDQESGLSQEPGNKSEETLKTQATNEWRGSVFIPCREEAPSHSVPVHVDDDLINTVDLGFNPCPVTPQGKNISGSKKQKKSAEPCSSKNMEKKNTEAQSDKLGKRKRTPRKQQQGGKGSASEKTPVEWPEPCPNFPFEPITTSEDDDSVIRRYLEQYYTATGSADGDVPLPDFGLPSFSNIIKVSQNEEHESKKYPDPPCLVQVASSSVPCCVPMVATMQQTVAGN